MHIRLWNHDFAEADYVMTNTPGMLEKMEKLITDFGVTPEIEAFDTGHLWYAKQLVSNGILKNLLLFNCVWEFLGSTK